MGSIILELVYLWVEDYKNIKKQGFNFSPKFHCEFKDEYDEKGKLKDNCKLIVKPQEHIENFFGDNINVTAIVGKNGSGKSSLIKLIFMLIYLKKYDDGDVITQLKQNLGSKKLFLIINTDEGLRKLSINCDGIVCVEPCEELYSDKIDFFSIYFNYISDTWYDGYEDLWVNEIYHKADNYITPLLLQPNKHDNWTLKNIIDLDMIEYLDTKKILQFYEDIDNNISITNFFKPNSIKLSRKTNFIGYSNSGEMVEFEKVGKIGSQLLKLFEKRKLNPKRDDNNKILEEIKLLETSGDIEHINLLYIVFKILLSDKSLFDETKYSELEKVLKSMVNDNKLISKEKLEEICFDRIIKDKSPEYQILKLRICINLHKNKIFNNENFKKLFVQKKLSLREEGVKNILPFIPPWLDIDFFDNNKSLKSLSSGEKLLFTIIVNLMYQLKNINAEVYDTINLFLDETELGLHPEWQKKYIINILESIKPLNNKGKKINIVFLTHSPFILSDLPKENVMFLKEGRQVKGTEKKQTFGANIHTLLSDSFFMEDGLMGEFAKSKIDKTIKLLNQEKLSEDDLKYCEQIISIIGEPIVKNQLQRMLDSKRLSKIDAINQKIKNMSYELEVLKQHQSKIVQDELQDRGKKQYKERFIDDKNK